MNAAFEVPSMADCPPTDWDDRRETVRAIERAARKIRATPPEEPGSLTKGAIALVLWLVGGAVIYAFVPDSFLKFICLDIGLLAAIFYCVTYKKMNCGAWVDAKFDDYDTQDVQAYLDLQATRGTPAKGAHKAYLTHDNVLIWANAELKAIENAIKREAQLPNAQRTPLATLLGKTEAELRPMELIHENQRKPSSPKHALLVRF